MDSDMRVLHVCTEIYPLLKTGGLADVLAGLTPAQIRLGADVRLLVPAFPAFREKIEDQQLVAELGPHFGAAAARLHIGRLPSGGAHVYLIDAPEFYGRPGNPYSDTANHAYSDNDRRFALLGWAGAQLAAGCDPYWRPQVVHGRVDAVLRKQLRRACRCIVEDKLDLAVVRAIEKRPNERRRI